jgi:O-antigen/teichoic acid export membrane protein
VLSLVSLLAVPAAAGIAAVAEPLVHVLLGEKWAAVAPVMAVGMWCTWAMALLTGKRL